MGKKKRGHPDLEELLNRPWCYYCERDFDDLKILISHQKAKHFKCDRCGRRLNTAGGLSVHMSQVHKESLSQVDNALPNRSSLDIEIFGMEGVPEDVLQVHNQRVLTQFHQAEAERRAATGNPPPGSAGGPQAKKPKFESPSDLKRRLAEHKAKLAEQSAGSSSGDVTPVGAGQGIQTGSYAATPQYSPAAAAQQPLNGTGQEYQYPHTYGQPPTTYPQPQISGGYPATAGGQHFPGTQYSPSNMSPSQFTPTTMASPASSTPLPFQQQQQQPMRTHTPPQASPSILSRPPSLPPAPGLPQRPSFAAPQVNAFQMQQMHHGQVSGPPPSSTVQPDSNVTHNGRGASGADNTAASVDRLVSEAAKHAVDLPAKPTPTPTPAPDAVEETPAAKPAKKEKAKTRMVYADNEISPEEKMARLPRYAYVPERKEETVMRDATAGVVV